MEKNTMSSTNLTPLQKELYNLRLVPVVSLPSVDAGLKLAEILVRCGLPVAEVTFRTSCATDAMNAIHNQFPDLLLLAGTVLTPEQADTAVASGASAVISPGFTPKMAKYCNERNIVYCPGVCTPSEVQMAMEAGLNSLKFFPAENSGGLKMIALFKAIYQDINFMPTGGINLNNLKSYLNHENILCCGGTWLAPEKMMVEEKWKEIEQIIIDAVTLLNN